MESGPLYDVVDEKPSPPRQPRPELSVPELASSSCFCFSSLYMPSYRLKMFRNKGTVIVLLWIFSGLLNFDFLIATEADHKTLLTLGSKVLSSTVIGTMCLLLYPLLGWLADVKFGRYVTVKWGLRLVWIMSILFCVASVLLRHFEPSYTYKSLVKAVIYVPLSLGAGAVLANILQLGVDQLVDASSSEITSFLRWYLWLWFVSIISRDLSQKCLCQRYEVLGFLLLPAVNTVAIAVDYLFGHCLVKEPVSDNPFILIKNVLRYAMKSKYPRLRSAFTYWDDKRYSRIDLGKNKFGGPFTTEQVEDVKTFFRIIIIILIATIFLSMCVSVFPAYDTLISHLHGDNQLTEQSCQNVSICFKKAAITNSGQIFMVIVLPVFEFVFYPFFKRYVQVSILKKVSYGMVFFLLSLAACTVIEFVGNSRLPHANVTCPLADGEHSSLPLDYKWMILPYTTNTIGQFLFTISAVEFLCAQSPYTMKGLLFGFGYGCVGFFAIVWYSLLMLVKYIVKKSLFNHYGCLSWYLLIALAFLFAVFVGFFVAFKLYKKRLRDDNEYNEQTFAENYFSQHLS